MEIKIDKRTIWVMAKHYPDGFSNEFEVDLIAEEFRDKKIGTLVTRKNVTRDEYLSVGLMGIEGVPGNSNPSILRTKGWRGTVDDVALFAHGAIKVIKVTAINKKGGYGYKITFKRLD